MDRLPNLSIVSKSLISSVVAFLLTTTTTAFADSNPWLDAVRRDLAGPSGISTAEDAAGVVNGRRSGTYEMHTGQDSSPWWQVDLEQSHSLGKVIIYAPHYHERLKNLEIRLSADGIAWTTAHRWSGATVATFDISLSGKTARFLRIVAPTNTWMHLDEVEVYAAADPKTNIALDQPADQSSASNWSSRSKVIPTVDAETLLTETASGCRIITNIVNDCGQSGETIAVTANQLHSASVPLNDSRWSELYDRATRLRKAWDKAGDAAKRINFRAIRMAIEDLASTYPDRYTKGEEYLARLDQYERDFPDIIERIGQNDTEAIVQIEAIEQFRREALLANPLLDFDRMVVLRRRFADDIAARAAMGRVLGVGTLNSHTNDSLPSTGWDNEIARLDHLRGDSTLSTLHKTPGTRILTDVEVDFDATRIMFASIGDAQNNWRLFEYDIATGEVNQVSPDDGADVGHFDACYLPDGQIILCSTASYQGLPCEFGNRKMVCLYRLDPASGKMRQLTFEQDSDWSPAMLSSGRVLYQRWEYEDLPHANSRMLFHMNPDGTGQMEYYGSGSYFPPSIFYARAVPGHATKVVGVAGGHHGTPRSGRLLLIDPALGRREADGVVQELPGWGKPVEPIVKDRLVDGVWPHFLHPYALSEKHFITAMKPDASSLWGIYLVDVYDNIVLLHEEEGSALLDPIPLQKTRQPPVLPDRVDLSKKTATVFLGDIYYGPGLKGVPRGSVKSLRICTYYYGQRGMGGLLGSIGMDGPWDIKRVLGTVPIESDGSAHFEIPANTPIFLQPLDAEGKAMQLMRSWMVGMPGEVVSCSGCHEDQNTVVPNMFTAAARRVASPIEPWYGPVRGFSYAREVQPVIDRYCLGCHDGSPRDDGLQPPNLRGDVPLQGWNSEIAGHVNTNHGGKFSVGYAELHRYVRRPGIESDLHMLEPGEFHADTTELVQMLRDGRHHNVQLDKEAWDRIVTWIDLNAPYHGRWEEIMGGPERITGGAERRRELARLYASVDVDLETIGEAVSEPIAPVMPQSLPPAPELQRCDAWPINADTTREMQNRLGTIRREIDLGEGVKIALIKIPAGRFVIDGKIVEIEQPFWLGETEITNAQFARFDPSHDSRHEDRHGYQFGRLCYPMNEPGKPAVRLAWNHAADFCRWLSDQTGENISLPTESEWEWAARAGSDTPFPWGDVDTDFSQYANLGDRRLKEFAACTARGGYTQAVVIADPNPFDDWVPKDDRVDDGTFLTAAAGRYRPNRWGMLDMHGNVWEWTATDRGNGRKIARGGSFYDRPKRCTSSSSLDYLPYHKVFNVGFRIRVAP